MPSRRTLVATALAAAVAALVASAPAGAVPHAQRLTLTIRAGDRVVEPNFALVPGVPVRIAVTNYTREFHTFTVPALKLSALIRPADAAGATTTIVSFTPRQVGVLAWHCAVCPSGIHGVKHEMAGRLYLLVDPSALG